jgi:isorenieratene synthase
MSIARRLEQLAGRIVEARLGGYRHRVVVPETDRPRSFQAPPRVAVVGGGVAGLTAALVLAERGAKVTLFERNSYLGGKLGGWYEELASPHGAPARLPVDHGFHAFFRHYYNLRALLGRLGLDRELAPIGDYRILRGDGSHVSFLDDGAPPLVNVFKLGAAGLYGLKDLASGRMARMERFFRYHPERTFATDDDRSFADFVREAGIPPTLQLVFNSFSRAFFADPDRMSLAELIKSFHFYYLSHDHGLCYDYLLGGYERALLAPLRTRLEALGVTLRTGVEVASLGRTQEPRGFVVEGSTFDDVVVASPAAATRALLEASPFVREEAPRFASQLATLRSGQRYAIVRLFCEREVGQEHPVFVITDRHQLLDSVTFLHRVDPELAAWAKARGGGAVYELHSYAVPDALPTDAVRDAIVAELERFFPALRGAAMVHEHVQVRDDFPAFHRGLAADRPGVETPIDGLLLAGDWVRLPVPAMLLEAACTSGLYAANAILARSGLQAEPIDSVPLTGMLAARDPRPARAPR